MRLPLLLLTLAPGCVFITAAEHAERLGIAETGPDDTGEEVETVLFGGDFSLVLTGRDVDLSCQGELSLSLRTEGGATTVEGAGSCPTSSPDDAELDGITVNLEMSGAVGSDLSCEGDLGLSADNGAQNGSWSGTRSSDGARLTGQLDGALQIKGQGKLDATGTWEATRLESL